MTIFWMIAGLMLLMAIVLALYPLIEEGTWNRSLLKKWPVIMLAIGLPGIAIFLTLILAKPAAVVPAHGVSETPHNNSSQGHELRPEELQTMTQRLQERLQKEPNNADGWAVLARSFGAMKRYKESSEAYARALALRPDNAGLMVDYADTLAMANGRSLEGEPEKLVLKVLNLEPDNLKALAMAGTIAYNRQDYQGAMTYWQRIVDVAPPDSPFLGPIRANLIEVQKLAGQGAPAGQKHASKEKPAQPAAVQARVSGLVQISPALKSLTTETDTVYIFARAAGEKRGPPLAILRKSVKDLPFSYTLDDTMAMSPSFNLSSASRVIVGARVSKSGNAMPTPGDIEGYSRLSEVGSAGVVVTIDSVLK